MNNNFTGRKPARSRRNQVPSCPCGFFEPPKKDSAIQPDSQSGSTQVQDPKQDNQNESQTSSEDASHINRTQKSSSRSLTGKDLIPDPKNNVRNDPAFSPAAAACLQEESGENSTGKQMPVAGILFDLDGTLWDSCRVVAEAWSGQLEKLGYDQPEHKLTWKDMRKVMGLSMDVLADRLLTFVPETRRMEVAHLCEVYENEYLAVHPGDVYPGIEEMLQTLKARGYRLGIVSNCQTGYIEAFLASSGLSEYFDDFESYGNTLKPKSQNIHLVQDRNRMQPCIYIGDTTMDARAAEEAGVPFIHAAYGFGQDEFEWKAQSAEEIPDLIEQLIRKR